MSIHKEGFATISLTSIFLLLLNYFTRSISEEGSWLRSLALILSVFLFYIVVQFFRKPTRHTPANVGGVIAPCDGKVVVIEEVLENEYFKEPRRQVSIFMSPLNVHINFNPISGIVSYFKYHPGKYLVAWHPKSSTENERTTVVVKNEKGVELLFRQIAGALARRICWYVDKGSPAKQGEEFGFIKFGSRVDIFLPLDAKINVNLNDKTVGGETIIATLS